MATAAHALAESYAVLTRLPAPHRLSPADALAVLEGSFLGSALIVALNADGYRAVLRRSGKEGIAGGRTYDASSANARARREPRSRSRSTPSTSRISRPPACAWPCPRKGSPTIASRAARRLLDGAIGAEQDRLRNDRSEGARRLQVDRQLEHAGFMDRQLRRARAAQDLVDVIRRST